MNRTSLATFSPLHPMMTTLYGRMAGYEANESVVAVVRRPPASLGRRQRVYDVQASSDSGVLLTPWGSGYQLVRIVFCTELQATSN